jgi:hypothetical protein
VERLLTNQFYAATNDIFQLSGHLRILNLFGANTGKRSVGRGRN